MELIKTVAQSVAVSVLCLYLFGKHTVVVAVVPLIIIFFCLLYHENEQPTRQLMNLAIVLTLAIGLVLPTDYDLFAPVTSFSYLILATNIDTVGYVGCLAIWAASVVGFIEDYGVVTIISLITSLVSIMAFIISGDYKKRPYGVLAVCGFFPVISGVFYDHLAPSGAPQSLVVLVGLSIGLSLL